MAAGLASSCPPVRVAADSAVVKEEAKDGEEEAVDLPAVREVAVASIRTIGATSAAAVAITPGIAPAVAGDEDARDHAAAARVRVHASSVLAPGATARDRAAAAATGTAIASVTATVASAPR